VTKPIKVICIAAIVSLTSCGGGGAAPTDPLVDNWNGTFTWERFVNGVSTGSPVNSTASGTISANRDLDLRLDFQPAPNFVYDRVLGNVNRSNQIVGGPYWYGVDPANSYGVHTHNSNLTLTGSTLVLELLGGNGTNQTWRATITLNRG
jgi:hypothetical protein